MIRVDGLVKKFGDFTTVDNISVEVPKGEIFAFLGPNGAGKTTTIKIFTALPPPPKFLLFLTTKGFGDNSQANPTKQTVVALGVVHTRTFGPTSASAQGTSGSHGLR